MQQAQGMERLCLHISCVLLSLICIHTLIFGNFSCGIVFPEKNIKRFGLGTWAGADIVFKRDQSTCRF